MSASNSTTCDFARSFIRWGIDTQKKPLLTVSRQPPTTQNDVRMPLDCLATIVEAGVTRVFGLGASCKTEQVFVERDVWMDPNADMCAVAGDGQFLIIKRWDRTDKGVHLHPPTLGVQPERQCVDPAAAFYSHSLTLRPRAARELIAIEDTIEALAGDREVTARTTWTVAGAEVTIEYPVKTVNFSTRHRYYQVDTGPVMYFGEPTGPNLIENFHLAYLAHLGGDWAEFIISQPTPLAGLPVSVHHYSGVRRVAAKHSLWVAVD